MQLYQVVYELRHKRLAFENKHVLQRLYDHFLFMNHKSQSARYFEKLAFTELPIMLDQQEVRVESFTVDKFARPKAASYEYLFRFMEFALHHDAENVRLIILNAKLKQLQPYLTH